MAALDKRQIRNILKQRRLAMSVEEVSKKSEAITLRLIQSSFFKQAKTIGIYLDIQNEVMTSKIIEYCLTHQKNVCVPKVIGDEMTFYQIKSLNDLSLGTFNILEPTTSKIVNEIDLMLVPLLGYNQNKNRIGYGKGFYDRYFKKYPCLSAGLAYSSQEADFKEESHDIALDYIINEDKIIS